MVNLLNISILLQCWFVTVLAEPIKFDLGGTWHLSNSNGSIHVNASVPGLAHTDLLEAGEISEPYHGYNDKDLAWIVAENWKYSLDFVLPLDVLQSDHVLLVFEGLSTIAAVFLNGKLVLSAENQFRVWNVEVNGFLQAGSNTLVVSFNSSTAYAAAADQAYNMSKHNITS